MQQLCNTLYLSFFLSISLAVFLAHPSLNSALQIQHKITNTYSITSDKSQTHEGGSEGYVLARRGREELGETKDAIWSCISKDTLPPSHWSLYHYSLFILQTEPDTEPQCVTWNINNHPVSKLLLLLQVGNSWYGTGTKTWIQSNQRRGKDNHWTSGGN